ncbi:MAG: type II toxin-antitoxin system RelB/DinJ family antitoxin [Bifidobacteriaceae bacterium]|jgi:addiction module RelB/DinJ family antitoxin|nr:type II toxin-antitoxin system RelB/DinJ family antitoxin [Bifidobacteriaceae bacterium]
MAVDAGAGAGAERINFRADRAVRRDAERVFHALGLNLSDGLNVFLRRVAAEQAIPFPLALTREEILGPELAAREAALGRVVKKETDSALAEGRPVARFDDERGEPYLQHPDGTRVYPDG